MGKTDQHYVIALWKLYASIDNLYEFLQIDWCAAYWQKFIQIVNTGIEFFVPVK